MICEIEGREPRRGMGAVRAVPFVAARAQHGQQRGAYLSRGADDESAHDSRTIPNLGGEQPRSILPSRESGARGGGGARGIGDAGAVLSQGASRQVMTRSLGAALPARMVARLSQSDFRPLLGRALPLITLDTEARPHPMLCSS